ncbi:MAG TPA: helix-turn-helix domain-containing protein, partial [Thermoguttaceae bacterium]|nr:helix-turn-helix domain-containing protein [Thermoguttaceae bacterium]
ATNDDLRRLVQEGRFRQDLYYRINVINIELPPLRERISDIPLLVEHFLQRICQETGRPARRISDEALQALQRYHWPGNVRELQNVIERAVLLGKGDVITLADLPPSTAAASVGPWDHEGPQPLKQALCLPERQIILDALEAHHWNRQATAAALGINRTTLYKKMKRLGLEPPRGKAVHKAIS